MRQLYFPPLQRELSQLVLGTMAVQMDDLESSFRLLDAWQAAGGNIVDTAHLYRGGSSERALGLWVESRGIRSEVVILTKCAHHNVDRKRVTPEDITCDLRDSLARLRTDWVDLYLLHRDDPDVPVGEIVDVLQQHQDAGRIRAYGGSNWSTARLDAANVYAAARGKPGFVASSPHLSLAAPREPMWDGCIDARTERDRAWYTDRQMPLFAWSSQARGWFTGSHQPGAIDDELLARVYDTPENWARLQRCRDLAGRRNAEPVQVALAWVLHQPFPVFPLIGPATPDELASSLGALQIALTPEEVRWLDVGA